MNVRETQRLINHLNKIAHEADQAGMTDTAVHIWQARLLTARRLCELDRDEETRKWQKAVMV